ncbi:MULTISPECIES: acetate--CoA ligase [unclassified Pseudoclavibacter]|uniref:acetate--CoA ligase n=1 Tax=unclassified Pseudoclavibacter TaxID=2615177 RepID=UPI000CE8E035|nr:MULTISPECIES: acetate--CoA ligase [unclassified Pseudoclavibacter]MBF4552238.1 acetate--CoA ligase [Pseudoclavibacter sp. VKM Ac-2888]PPF74554.1 acetate--CoA ligase [Pseudoclavibacter sp. Z016]
MADKIEHLLEDLETFPPSDDFTSSSPVPADLGARAEEDRLGFWAEQAKELHWSTPFTEVLDWSDAPFAKWFADGTLNASFNCVDRHVLAGNGDRVAIYWEGEPGDKRTITYSDLLGEVKRAANLLESLGVAAGDVVAIYMPMIPETVVAMLACARIGAIHSVIFGGFSADSIRSRVEDANAKLVITSDGSIRKGRIFPLKETVDAALEADGHTVEHVLVVRRADNEPSLTPGRDLWWHEEISQVSDEHVAKPFPAEHPLFILYTSGTTGKPKGLLHTTGGYLTQTSFTHRTIFDLKPEQDVYWCSADVGWVTGHSYFVYGPLANGATQVMYEGTHDTPDLGRWFDIIERYGVTIFYTAPTAIRGYMKSGRQIPAKYDLSSIRLLGSVGEPINPEAWSWYREVIGGNRVPVVDTWWQTETGAIMISAIPSQVALKPGAAQVPVPGVVVEVVDDKGERVNPGEMGLLTITEPWPSMTRGIYGDRERFIETYWSQFPGRYFAGDGAGVDKDGHLWLLGRVDDVMNVSGHRLSTTEIESALVDHPFVAESAVVGASDETTGQAVVAFVVLKESKKAEIEASDAPKVLREHVSTKIGAIARPRQVYVVAELPKTRSGKIMRRLLRDVADGKAVGDTTTLTDASVMSAISSGVASGAADDD